MLTDLRSRSYYGMLAPVTWNELGKHTWETCPVSTTVYTPPGFIFDCDPLSHPCAGQTPLPLPIYSPKWRDDHYTWPMMADGLSLTGDELFARRVYKVLTGNSCSSGCLPIIVNQMHAVEDPTQTDYSEWSNRSVLLGRVE